MSCCLDLVRQIRYVLAAHVTAIARHTEAETQTFLSTYKVWHKKKKFACKV